MKFWIPRGIVFNHRVEDHQQLSHAGSENNLEGFAGGFQPLCEVANQWIATSSGESRHVKHAADRRPATPDRASTMELATVTIERSHAGQGSDLLPVETSQFGQVYEQARDGHRTDTRH